MISYMRSKVKSKGSQIIIWIAIFSMVGMASIPEILKRFFGNEEWVFNINGSKVSIQEFANKIEEEKRYIEYFKAQLGAYGSNLWAASGLNLNPVTLAKDAIINETLLNKLVSQMNIQVDPEVLKFEITKKIPNELLKTYGGDINALSYALGYPNVAAFEKNIEQGIKQGLILDIIHGALYVPSFEVKNRYENMFAKKKFSILIFPHEKYVNELKKTPVSQDDLKKFFDEQNKDKKYWIAEKRDGIKWEFDPISYGIKVTDKEIESYYNKNRRTQFIENPLGVEVRRILFKVKNPKETSAVIQKAQKIYSELLSDKTKFIDYVKKYSDAKEQLLINKNQKDPVIEKAAFDLKADGDISNIIESSEGIEILQRVSKKPITFKKIENVKSQIRATLEKEKFNKLFALDMRRFISESKDQEAFNEFAKKKNAKESKINLIKNDGSAMAEKLFGIKNENGSAFYLDNNKGAYIKVTQIQKSHAPSFESVKKDVENDFYNQKANQKLKEQVEKAKKQASIRTFDKIKDEFGVTLKNTGWISQEDRTEVEKLQKENISVGVLFGLDKEGAVSEYINDKAGYLIRLDSIEPFNKDKFDQNKRSIEQELMRKGKQDIETGFIASLKKNAKIKINEKAMQQFKQIR